MSGQPGLIEPTREVLEDEGPLAPPFASAQAKAARAVGFLEGMSAWLWQQVGPNLADGTVIEYDRRVADIADYIGLPRRE